MALSTVDDIAQDSDFRRRVQIAALKQGIPNPESWAMNNMLQVACAPGFEEAYASAQANPYQVRNGENPSVISDGQIIAAVYAIAHPHEPDENPETSE